MANIGRIVIISKVKTVCRTPRNVNSLSIIDKQNDLKKRINIS